jgi:hypothetical protein
VRAPRLAVAVWAALLAGGCGGADDAQLGRIARRGLERHLADTLPWVTQPIRAMRAGRCGQSGDATCVDVEYAPHRREPRSTHRWVVACRRDGWDAWACESPDELTVVHLAQGDRGSLTFEVTVPEAAAALSAVLRAARGPGIPSPFAGGEPLRAVAPDTLQAVLRDPSCADVVVLAHRPAEGVLLELCVETPPCEEDEPCTVSVRMHGERSLPPSAGS